MSFRNDMKGRTDIGPIVKFIQTFHLVQDLETEGFHCSREGRARGF